MASNRETNRGHQRRFLDRQRAQGRRRLTLQVPPEHVAAHRAAAAGRPQELAQLREHVAGKVRAYVIGRLDRWHGKNLMRAARAEARMHPAGSNAPPARVRFGHSPPEEFRLRLREAGWWYDWISVTWHPPEDPGRWAETGALIAEAEAAEIRVERLAPGPAIEDLDTPVMPSASAWRQYHPEALRSASESGASWMQGFRTIMQAARREQLDRLTEREEPPRDPVRLSLWVRVEDAESHQLAAWSPHAMGRLRDRLAAELAPEVRRRVALRMARQTDGAREMQERAGRPVRIRFVTRPPATARNRLKDAGWRYDPAGDVWIRPPDPARRDASAPLLEELAEAYGVRRVA